MVKPRKNPYALDTLDFVMAFLVTAFGPALALALCALGVFSAIPALQIIGAIYLFVSIPAEVILFPALWGTYRMTHWAVSNQPQIKKVTNSPESDTLDN